MNNYALEIRSILDIDRRQLIIHLIFLLFIVDLIETDYVG
jgi:hypothetical protein